MEIETVRVSRSLLEHHIKYEDTYLKYLKFRTLHHRFYTNDKLLRIGIKQSSTCGICKIKGNSVEHMLLHCSYSSDI